MPRKLSLIAIATLPLLAACGGAPPPPAAPRALPVRVATVETRDLEDRLALNGSLRPRRQVEVVAEVAARLVAVVRDEGARVGDGEVIARLDDTDYRLAHDRARAALAVAEANQAHAVAEKERADNLRQTGGITDKDHLAAEVGLQVAAASVLQAKAEVAIAAQQLARCEIKAPFAGRVARRHADPGAMLANGTPIFTVVDDAVLEFRSEVPSADFGKLKLGAPVSLTVDALDGYVAEGRLVRIAPLVDDRNRTFEAVVEVANGQRLVGGLFARAAVRVGTVPGALVVPPAALVRDGAQPDRALVFVVIPGDKAERREVTLGVESAEATQVREGLRAGEKVVLDPPASLSNGAPVEPQASVAPSPRG